MEKVKKQHTKIHQDEKHNERDPNKQVKYV
jgi:hypothetical protein